MGSETVACRNFKQAEKLLSPQISRTLDKFLRIHMMIQVPMDEKYLLDLLGRRSTEKWNMCQD